MEECWSMVKDQVELLNTMVRGMVEEDVLK